MANVSFPVVLFGGKRGRSVMCHVIYLIRWENLITVSGFSFHNMNIRFRVSLHETNIENVISTD